MGLRQSLARSPHEMVQKPPQGHFSAGRCADRPVASGAPCLIEGRHHRARPVAFGVSAVCDPRASSGVAGRTSSRCLSLRSVRRVASVGLSNISLPVGPSGVADGRHFSVHRHAAFIE